MQISSLLQMRIMLKYLMDGRLYVDVNIHDKILMQCFVCNHIAGLTMKVVGSVFT